MFYLNVLFQRLIKLILLILMQNGITHTNDLQPTVNLPQGRIVGVKVYPDVPGVAINAFLGIPYAEPPEGRLRFAVPERHRGWNGTLYVGNFGPVCPFHTTSYDQNGKEDCLYLNIWTPEDAINKNLPVLVYLESEQIIERYPYLKQIPGHDLAAEGSVIVSVNYRQNIFGFFCLGTREARGNLGLLDQYMALLWIKENISKFGGDPQTITLMGHSSAAVTTMYQIISPRTKGLFNSAIIMSGSATAVWYSKNPITISKKIIRDLGCALSPMQMILECMRTKSVQELLRNFHREAEDEIWDKSVIPIVDNFLPEEDRFLPSDLHTALKERGITIPVLTGITDFLSNAEQWKWNDLNQDFNQLVQYAEESVIPSIIQQYEFQGSNKNIIKNIIHWRYLSSATNAHTLVQRIHDLQWDALVAAPHDKQLEILTNSSLDSNIYAYCLHQFDSLANVSRSTISGDLLLLFGPALLQQVARRRFNLAEARLSKLMKLNWINFAKHGNPIISENEGNWLPYDRSTKHVHYFGTREKYIYSYQDGVNLWNKLLPHIVTISYQANIPKELQYSPDPAAGFRHAMYTLIGLVVALLALLLVCVVLLKKRAKERNRHLEF